jgi:hypothetical protein
MMHMREMATTAIVEELGEFFAKKWNVGAIHQDIFMITAPSGSVFTVDGIHLPYVDDECVSFDMLNDEQQREEIDAERICDLVVSYRLRTECILTNDLFVSLKAIV